MDCCGSSKSKEKDEDVKGSHVDNENTRTEKTNGKDVKTGTSGHENSPSGKEQAHGGGCCGGGSGMWLHLIIMLIVFGAIWFFTKR
jgi:hypothetical protein